MKLGRELCRIHVSAQRLLQGARNTGAERCGLLFGKLTNAAFQVSVALELDNRALQSDCFRMDPAEMAGHARRQRASGLDLLGAWHTHPKEDAGLSAHDRGGAPDGWLSLIVGSGGELRAFEHGATGDARELELDVDQAPRPQ